MHAADRMRMTRELIFEVHDAWLALTAAAAQDTPFIDLQFDPNWSVQGQRTTRHTAVGSRDPVRRGRSPSGTLTDGPWV